MVHKFTQQSERGFALLMSLIVVGVLISIGLTVLELTITQVRLSTNARASEVAFNAANAGLECAQYIRRMNSVSIENGNAINPGCFGVATPDTNTRQTMTGGVTGDGSIYQYEYSFSWGGDPADSADDDRCSRVTTIAASADADGAGATLNEATTRGIIAGYPPTAGDFNCVAGGRCTILSVQGFNKPCGERNSFGTVQREVLVQF